VDEKAGPPSLLVKTSSPVVVMVPSRNVADKGRYRIHPGKAQEENLKDADLGMAGREDTGTTGISAASVAKGKQGKC
jgi:hypothetical protein